MKIDRSSLTYIQNLVRIANLFKINSIIIEPNRIRAIDDARSVFILQEKDVPVMPFGSIGMNRLDLFASRFEIIKASEDYSIEAVVEGDTTPFARSLSMKSKGIKIDYRCANPATIQAPKAMNDAIKHKVKITPAMEAHIQKGQSAMAADEITFVGTKDGVSFEITDINTDKLIYEFSTAAENVVDGDVSTPTFIHKYPIKVITTLFKNSSHREFFLTSRGMLQVEIDGVNVIALPRT